MKKIFFLITSLDIGGAEMILRDLAMGLDKGRFEPVVVSIKPLGPLSKILIDNGCKVFSLGAKGKMNPMIFWRLIKIVKDERPALVNAHLFHAVILGRLLKIFFPRLPIISTLHNEYQGGKRREQTLQYTDFLSENTTTISKKISAMMVERKVTSKEKILTLYNGVDFDRFFKGKGLLSEEDFKKEVPVKEGEKLIITWGRCMPAKGFDLLIRAVRILRDRGHKVSALIIGGGAEYENLKVLRSNLELEEYIFLPGAKENSQISSYVGYADMFVAPSRWEGMPVVIVEAMASRLPVVAVNVGGTGELVVDNETGFLVAHSEKVAIANRIEQALSVSKEDRKAVLDKAEENVRNNFSVQSMVAGYTGLFERYVSKRKKIIWLTNGKNDIYFNFFSALAKHHPELDLVMVISAREEGEETLDGYRLVKFRPRWRGLLKMFFVHRWLKSFVSGKKADLPNLNIFKGWWKFLKKERPDLFFGNLYSQPTCLTAFIYCLFFRVPFVLGEEKRVYGLKGFKDFLKLLPLYIFAPVFLFSKRIFCFSKDCYDFALRFFPSLDKKRIGLLPAGIDTDVFCKRPSDDHTGPLRILMVARMVPFKRYEDLFRAAKSLKERALFDFVINVRGDGPMEQQLKKMVDDFNIGSLVNFLPPVDNKEIAEKLYSRNDVQVLPSINEPIGIVVPEGMACGLPAIVSDTCGCKTYIEDGVNGYIFKTHDYFDLAEKIARLADKERRDKFSVAAIKTINDGFSSGAVAEKFYKEVAQDLWI